MNSYTSLHRGDLVKVKAMEAKTSKINIVLQEEKNVLYQRENEVSHPLLEQIDKAFADLINMNEIKGTLKEIGAMLWINQQRENFGLLSTKQVLHMLFTGNPGTGKTTVARKLAKIYYEWNFLSKGQFIEVERADLVGEYIGQTAQKTRALIQKAQGGILFIDEAYSLSRGGEKDFGKEAIDTLVTHMENNYTDFVLILAGYPNEMENFLNLNPGLQSRFPFIIDFPDFSGKELLEVAKKMVMAREFSLTKEAEWHLQKHFHEKTSTSTRHFANARYVRNTIEHAIRKQAVRLMKKQPLTAEDLIFLSKEDFSFL